MLQGKTLLGRGALKFLSGNCWWEQKGIFLFAPSDKDFALQGTKTVWQNSNYIQVYCGLYKWNDEDTDVSQEIQTTVPWESKQLGLGQRKVKWCATGELLPFYSLAVAGHWNTGGV